MKKQYLAKRNALLSSSSALRSALVLAFFLLILLVRIFAPDFFWQMTAPLFRASGALAESTHGFIGSFSSAAAVSAKNDVLTSENAALANENQMLLAKVADLSALLGNEPQKAAPGVLASVVARPPLSPYDTLLVAAGKRDGVFAGMEAFGNANTPIGTVTAGTDAFSRVTLFTAPGVVTAGWVGKGGKMTALTLTGRGGGAMSATVTRDAGIAIGDTVFAPGPGPLPVGTIVRADTDPLSPSVTLRIRSAANLFSLGSVLLRDTGVAPLLSATSTLP